MKRSTVSVLAMLSGLAMVAGCTSPTTAETSPTASTSAAQKAKDISLTKLGTYRSPFPAGAAIEISAHDPVTHRVFSVNSINNAIEVIDFSDPSNPVGIATFVANGIPNSVAIRDGRAAVASQAADRVSPGNVTFYDVNTLTTITSVTVGAVPDMVTFTPDGSKLLVANEGEPADFYASDPEGSVSIIDVPSFAVRTATFAGVPQVNAASIRVFGPGSTAAQDYEPEYITVSENGKTAWVTLQENNAIAILDLQTETFTSVVGLGFKDWGAAGNTMDASDRDSALGNMRSWPGVLGMYQPDSIGHYKSGGSDYIVMANEGDAREWPEEGDGAFIEVSRARSLCPTGNPADLNCQIAASWPGWQNCAFPPCYGTSTANGILADRNLGRLNVTNKTGRNGDGKYENLYAFGARSFSIRDANGNLVFDSGNFIEQKIHELLPGKENSTQNPGVSPDNRSDDKGPEPEGLVLGKFHGRTYAFIGLERIGGVMVFDITNAHAPRYVTYVNNRQFTDPEPGDLGPEGLAFISEEESPTGQALLLVSNEISGTLTAFAISDD